MILFYSEEITPRIEFITQLIFTKIHRVEVSFTTNQAEFVYSELPKINYSHNKLDDGIYLKPHGLLSQSTLVKVDVKPFEYNNYAVFFESSPDSVFPFDPFAASFCLVTRYEEYL